MDRDCDYNCNRNAQDRHGRGCHLCSEVNTVYYTLYFVLTNIQFISVVTNLFSFFGCFMS